jgi:carbamoyl-phosphate synthase/aspartate carbamoyltransferase
MSTLSKIHPGLEPTPSISPRVPTAPVTGPVRDDGAIEVDGVLELSDGSAFRGVSFGAEGKSVAGECVFQTGALVFKEMFDIF